MNNATGYRFRENDRVYLKDQKDPYAGKPATVIDIDLITVEYLIEFEDYTTCWVIDKELI